MSQHGKLYGVGVGPGDAELMTFKAARVIEKADVIFTAASSKNTYSLAVEIAKPHICRPTPTIFLPFPMTSDETVKKEAWNRNAREIADVLAQGLTAVFLTLGDPMTYSTFGYVLKSLKHIMPHADIETIPGITSYQAASARINRILVEAEESLLITSGAYGGDHLRECTKRVENVVMMKAYKNVRDINEALKDSGFSDDCVAISKCGRKGEEIIENVDALEMRPPNYWTLILAGRRKHV